MFKGKETPDVFPFILRRSIILAMACIVVTLSAAHGLCSGGPPVAHGVLE